MQNQILSMCMLISVMVGCKAPAGSCLNSDESGLAAPMADEVLRQNGIDNGKLIATGTKDASSTRLAFLLGSHSGGIKWQAEGFGRFVLSGSTYILFPDTDDQMYREYTVNSSGGLTYTGIAYGTKEFQQRPILRPLLRVPAVPRYHFKTPALLETFRQPMANFQTSSCGGYGLASMSSGASEAGSGAKAASNTASSSAAGGSEATASKASSTTASRSSSQSNGSQAESRSDSPSSDSSVARRASPSFHGDPFGVSQGDIVRRQDPQDAVQELDAPFESLSQWAQTDRTPLSSQDREKLVDSLSALPQDDWAALLSQTNADKNPGSEHQTIAPTLSKQPTTVGQWPERTRDPWETSTSVQDIVNAGSDLANDAKDTAVDVFQRTQREAELLKKDFQYALEPGAGWEMAKGAGQGFGDGTVLITNAAVNGVGGSVKQLAEYASNGGSKPFNEISPVLSSSLADSAEQRKQALDQTSPNIPFGTAADLAANVAVQAGTAVVNPSNVAGKVVAGLDYVDAAAGVIHTGQAVADGNIIEVLKSGSGVILSNPGLRKAKNTNATNPSVTPSEATPNATLLAQDPKVRTGSDVDPQMKTVPPDMKPELEVANLKPDATDELIEIKPREDLGHFEYGQIPKHYEIKIGEDTVFVNANGTKHLLQEHYEHYNGKHGTNSSADIGVGNDIVTPPRTLAPHQKVAVQERLKTMARSTDAYLKGVKDGSIQWGDKKVIDGHEIIIEQTGKNGPYPTLKHYLQVE